MIRVTLVALAGVAVLLTGTALAQQNRDFSKVEIKTTDLGNKTYMLQDPMGKWIATGTRAEWGCYHPLWRQPCKP
jgi:hypothetical protein